VAKRTTCRSRGFDNRKDKTTFVRVDRAEWKPDDVAALHGGLSEALAKLAMTSEAGRALISGTPLLIATFPLLRNSRFQALEHLHRRGASRRRPTKLLHRGNGS
jgi:hypothetical protein